jgi:hypothetical protein
MVIAGREVAVFRKEIMAVAPALSGKPAVFEFLLALSRMCARAHRENHSLHVVAD